MYLTLPFRNTKTGPNRWKLAEIIQVHSSSRTNNRPTCRACHHYSFFFTRGRFKQVHSLFAPGVKIKLAWRLDLTMRFPDHDILLQVEYLDTVDVGWLNINFALRYITHCISWLISLIAFLCANDMIKLGVFNDFQWFSAIFSLPILRHPKNSAPKQTIQQYTKYIKISDSFQKMRRDFIIPGY